LSKQVLRGERDRPWLRAGNDYTGLDLEITLQNRATSLDVGNHVIHCEQGPISYDTLVVATGVTPRRVSGIGGYVLRTWDDAVALRAALSPGSRLGIIGAGLVGCEVAASARAMGVEVTLLDVLSGPLVRVVGAQVCELVAELHRGHGVELRMGTVVTRDECGRLLLNDPSALEVATLEVDAVLEAIGATPDTDWLVGSELSLNDGIVCDAYGRAGADVFAVGDVARWDGVRTEHWTNAGTQADQVAATILGQDPPAAEVAYWWSDQYDVKLQGLGSPNSADDVTVISWGPRERTVAVYSRADQLTGVVGFSAAGAVSKLRALIAVGASLTDALSLLEG
jgi:3-phenylpropionate/trans-cinnamate dioxygenase ferredoxin reductase subunit